MKNFLTKSAVTIGGIILGLGIISEANLAQAAVFNEVGDAGSTTATA